MKTFSVALVGPDGSGKTTISRRLQETFAAPIKYVYMGVNPESSNLMLPTTRLAHAIKRLLGVKPSERGPRDPNEVQVTPKSPAKRALRAAKSGLRLTNQIAEEWFRQGLTWYYERRGYIVLFDRHFFCDYYSYDIAPTDQTRPLSRRIHGALLKSVYPKPDLMIYLNAPADVLLARKGEGTLEILEGRREAYMEMRGLVPCFVQVDATQPEDAVLQEVTNMILEFRRNHRQR
jgi:thymidylate kinase